MPAKQIFKLILPALLFLAGAAPTYAVSFQEKAGPRALSVGGAYRAIGAGNDALFYNPAALVFYPRFSLELDYLYRIHDNEHFPGISLVDSITSPLAVGLDYHPNITLNNGKAELSHIATIAMAYPLVAQFFSLGAALRYLHLPEGEGPAAGSHVTADVGLMAKTPIGLSLAAVGYNLIPTTSPNSPLNMGFGIAWNFGGIERPTFDEAQNKLLGQGIMGGFTISSDILMRDLINRGGDDFQVHAGAEYDIVNAVPLRAGYRWNKNEDSHTLAFGTGLVIHSFGLDAYYEIGIVNNNKQVAGGALKFYF